VSQNDNPNDQNDDEDNCDTYWLGSWKDGTVVTEMPTLPREQREYVRFMNVRRKKDFICFERVNGKLVNILEGLELHTGIFSVAE